MALPFMKALTLRSGEPPMINEGPGSAAAGTGHATGEEAGEVSDRTVAKRGAVALLALGACMVAGRILLQRKAR
ncbi:hypothetical protein J4573_38875 [Actinomadura barringtoniae]|uniref:Uncharacterized protein n=1 Tax=Actinomadura barringtoniae TaxID=1427535 RepID=A0A939T4Y4_9ACTN|nr:hypothetical protein [Actinomadura barringtoniae]MBO2453111.1 hypothetical protein [Actinomadura barringtoniae]